LSETSNSQSKNRNYDRFFDGLAEILFSAGRITKEAFKTKFYRKKENWILYFCFVTFAYLTLIKGQYGHYLDFFCVRFLPSSFYFCSSAFRVYLFSFFL